MTLDEAQENFRTKLTTRAAGEYMETLMEYEADGMIGDDTWLDGLAEIKAFLFL